MAQNVSCLSALYESGYDFKSLDYSGRTPLFVACALNRIDCAQFILDCLEAPEHFLILQDNRGDTPLHAAACNGSVECVLLILQFAIDPTIKNNKGLAAIDLAVKKKQQHCVKMLAEYTLHYETSADFDSQFLIAAIEVIYSINTGKSYMYKGHKRILELKGSIDAYEIIQREVSPSSSKDLTKRESFFSENANRSIRLQRWGCVINANLSFFHLVINV